MQRRVLVSLCVIVLLASAAGYAATTGRLNGTVKDNDGLALPGVTVQITSVNLMGSQVAITGGDGTFSFAALPIGVYTVEASLVGFQGATGEVRVSLDGTASVAFTLVPEQFADEIIVEATVPVCRYCPGQHPAGFSTRIFSKTQRSAPPVVTISRSSARLQARPAAATPASSVERQVTTTTWLTA